MKNSKIYTIKVIPSIVKNNVKSYEKSENNFIRSTALLNQGGLLTKTKYKETRKEKVDFMPEVSIDRFHSRNHFLDTRHYSVHHVITNCERIIARKLRKNGFMFNFWLWKQNW